MRSCASVERIRRAGTGTWFVEERRVESFAPRQKRGLRAEKSSGPAGLLDGRVSSVEESQGG